MNLHDQIINELGDAVSLRTGGVVTDLPAGTTLNDYRERLAALVEELQTMPVGRGNANAFEELVGDVLKLCFFRSLTNVEPKVRDVGGIQIRDWICANTAVTGFWEQMRARYRATQVVVECKNYEQLEADDFHQALYYMQPSVGNLVIIAFRGAEISAQYLRHISKIARDKDGIILLWRPKDLQVFLRQSMNGKMGDAHVQDIFDQTVRRLD